MENKSKHASGSMFTSDEPGQDVSHLLDDEVLSLDWEIELPNSAKTLACRFGFHSYVTISPSDEEYEEIALLTGQRVYGMVLHKDVLDRICHRCGHVDLSLQRMLAYIRRVRKLGIKR